MGIDTYSLRMSFANYITTGNPIIDNLILSFLCLWLTTLLSFFNLDYLSRAYQWFIRLFKSKDKTPKMNSVLIKYEQSISKDGNLYNNLLDDFSSKNNYLIESFYYFMNQQSKIIKESEMGITLKGHNYSDETMRDYLFKFRPLESVKYQGFEIEFIKESTSSEDDENNESENNSRFDYLLNNDKKKKAPGNKKTNKDGFIDQTQTKTIKISSQKSMDQIYEFIENVYHQYIDNAFPKVDRTKNKPKFYYLKRETSKNSLYGNRYLSFHRYALKSKTTFDDIYFDGKQKLVSRIDNFLTGESKLSKFSILLYGPPGGGKSSFIKALHNYTGYHIFVVKLSEFKDLDELIKLFHEPNILNSDGIPINVPINERIYLFEDIDAEDEIVHRRSFENNQTTTDPLNLILNIPDQEKTTKSPKKPKRKRRKYKFKHKYGPKEHYGDSESESSDEESEDDESDKKIKLAGILNLLDGVLELNDCFVVMTTNHVEKLDPALIRPGRMTYRLELGYINAIRMKEMILKFIPDFQLDDPNPKLNHILSQMPQDMMPCHFEELVQHEPDLPSVINNLESYLGRINQRKIKLLSQDLKNSQESMPSAG